MKNILMIILGSFIYGFGINIFIKANGLALGGFSGIGLILNYNFGFSIGAFILLANLPLMIIAYKVWGMKYVFNTIIGVVASSAAVEIFSSLAIVVDDPLMPAIYGGLCSGVGTGIVMRGSGTMGGTDVLAQLSNKYLGTALGSFYLCFDGCVLISVALIYGLTTTLYSLVAVFISSHVVNIVVDGLDSSKQALIISSKYDEIGTYITEDLHRGFTYLHGRGGYRGSDEEIIMCVVSRWQIFRLRNAVHRIDPTSFIIISDAYEVYGMGFRSNK
jgi:uncharacterized membrane-anchored protein YitT (DUF2179 family)